VSFLKKGWFRYLPVSLQRKIEHRPNLQKVLNNISWLFADRFFRMGGGLLISIWIARYLGPKQFGLMNYAIAFVALFGSIATLGLNSIVVKDLIKRPENADVTLGTTFVLQIIGGLLACLIAILAISYVRPNDLTLKLMTAILGFAMVFKSVEVVRYWFEAQVQSKYIVWVENLVFLLFAVVKVFLIFTQATLIDFIWVIFAETVLMAFFLLILYSFKVGQLKSWKLQYGRTKELLKDGWPLMLSGLAVMVYMRIDQIMLGQMMGDQAVGVYSAAVRISEVFYFIPVAIAASVFPSIIEAKKHSEALYYKRLQRLYDLMVIFTLSVAIPMTFFSDVIIHLLFGSAYVGAGPILSIHIWAGLFVSLGVISSRWIVIENLQMYALYRTGLGVLINISANVILIPKYGSLGAAIGTLISQVLATYMFDILTHQTRPSFWLKTASLIPINFIRRKANGITND